MTNALYRFFAASLVLATACLAAEAPRPFAGSFQTKDDAQKFFDENVAIVLIKGERDLHEWADELERTEPQSPQDVWTTFQVCLRAGRDETACKMMPLLFNMIDSLPPESDNRSTDCSVITNFLRTIKWTPERWHVVTTFCEVFDTVYYPSYDFNIVTFSFDENAGFNADLFKQAGWSNKEIKDWLEKRLQNASNREGTLSKVAKEWQRRYLARLRQTGEFPAELERLHHEAKESPLDAKKWDLLLNAMINTLEQRKQQWNRELYKKNDPLDPPPKIPDFLPDLDWLIPTAEERSPFEAWSIVKDVERLEQRWPQNIRKIFLERALAVPLTAAECEQYRRVLEAWGSPQPRYGSVQKKLAPDTDDDAIRDLFQLEVTESLFELYYDKEQWDEAQKFIPEVQRLKKKYGLSRYYSHRFSNVERITGKRIVEEEIHSREATEATQPAYWMERAEYYWATDKESHEAALWIALKLFDSPELRRSRSEPTYGDVCRALFRCFWPNREQEGADFFLKLHAQFQNEPMARYSLYHNGGSDVMRHAKRDDEYNRMIEEDLQAAWNWLKNNPNPTERDDIYEAHWYFVNGNFNEILHKGWLDLENDSFLWDWLEQMDHRFDRVQRIERILFPPSDENRWETRGRPDAAAIRFFEKGMREGKLSPDSISRIGTKLTEYGDKPEHYEKALPFLDEALKGHDEKSFSRRWILRALAICWLELGDWCKGESYSIEGFSFHWPEERFLVDNLRRAADMAEAAGEPAEAERIRRRIANLGSHPI